MNGQLRAVKQDFVPSRDANGGEVLDLEVADFVGLVFDIHPAELGAGESSGKCKETGSILHAGIAPLGAKAAHHDHA